MSEPVTSIFATDAVTVRIYKRLTTNPMIVWANTYELLTNFEGSADSGAFTSLCQALQAAEAAIHLISTQFIRGVVSTLVADSKPYNPSTFVAVGLSGNGLRDNGDSQPEPLQFCLRISKQVASGRQGFELYRNCLLESDVASPSGTPALVSDLSGPFTSYVTAMTSSPIMAGNFRLAMIRNVIPDARLVSGFTLAGVTIKKFNNRYFDRAASV